MDGQDQRARSAGKAEAASRAAKPWIVRIRNNEQNLIGAVERSLLSQRLSAGDREAITRRPTIWNPQSVSRKLAVFVTHGMGQQLPFETAAVVAEGLIAYNPQFAGELVPVSACNTADKGGQHLQFQARDVNGERIEVHVHEGYWAPLTEGRVRVGDILRFLYLGAFNSIRNWRFTRYMFGRTVDCRMSPLSHLRLFLTTVILSFFVLFSFIVGCTLVALALREWFGLQSLTWPSAALVDVMNRIVALFLAMTGVFGVALWFPIAMKKRLRQNGWWHSQRARRLWRGTTDASQVAVWGWCGATVACLVFLVAAIIGEQRSASGFVAWANQLADWPLRVEAPFWLATFAAVAFMRTKLVQFMGDVAAYVSPHMLDRFMNIRQDIKRWVFDAVRHVYESKRADGQFEYDGVVLAGHSLGSVVIYDALNALLNEDALSGDRLRVAERTRMLLTFGSPLDKTAFIFSQHRRPTAETRGLMAAAVQPLICSYERFRRIRWVNICSPRDPVCDPLRLYDDLQDVGFASAAVQNVVDRDARVPLMAHTEYWDNACLYGQLWSGIGAVTPAPAAERLPAQEQTPAKTQAMNARTSPSG